MLADAISQKTRVIKRAKGQQLPSLPQNLVVAVGRRAKD
jgi:hypothetical protein